MFKSIRILLLSFGLVALSISPAHAEGPTNLVLPIVLGTPIVGGTLALSPGTWTPEPSSRSIQWFKCSSLSSMSCALISGGTGETFKLTSSEAMNYIKASITALSLGGGTTIQTGLTQIVSVVSAPTTLPVVSGDALRTSTLTTTAGIWNVPSAGFTYQWVRCETSASDTCNTIAGATLTTYSLGTDDVGKYMRTVVSVTPFVAGYSPASATSQALGPILSGPVQVGTTTLVGKAIESETLTVSLGKIVASPAATISYVWQKCLTPSIASCSPIPGEIGGSLVVTSAYNGNYLRVVPTIQNDLDGLIRPSSVIGPVVKPTPPMNTTLPSITGAFKVGYQVIADPGIWTGTPTPEYVTTWQICATNSVSSCVDVPSNSTVNYTPLFADAGKYLSFKVSGKNRLGVASAQSPLVAPVELVAKLVSKPVVFGFGIVGSRMTSMTAEWTGLIDPVYKYQWQRCAKADATTCVDVPGSTDPAYPVVRADQDKWLRVGMYVPNQTFIAYSAIGKDAIYPGPDSLAEIILVLLVPITPVVIPLPVITPVVKPVVKATTITCIKGTLSKKVTAVNPKCPLGYKKK